MRNCRAQIGNNNVTLATRLVSFPRRQQTSSDCCNAAFKLRKRHHFTPYYDLIQYSKMLYTVWSHTTIAKHAHNYHDFLSDAFYDVYFPYVKMALGL